ncbi:MAG: hypothetical protein U0X39_05870 [Bacteroidales bacterium]
MKYKLLSLMIAVVSISGCEKIDKDCPDCIQKQIREFSKSPICDEGATVAQYFFQNMNVYVFSEGNCGADMGAKVVSENCDQIGYLGGIAGNMKINGVNFYENAVFRKTVWED